MGSNGQLTGETWQPDLDSGINSWGHAWDTRLKIISLLIFVFGVVSLSSIYTVLASLFLSIISVISARIRLSFLLQRIKGVLPFLVFIYLGLILGRGLEHFYDSLYLGGLVSLKALTSITATLLVLKTQSLEEVFKGLSHLRLPPILVSVLFLSYRYVFMFVEILRDTRRALASRGFSNIFCRQTLKVYGEITGALFVKALDRSEIVLQAMEARGFDGRACLPLPINSTLQVRDLLKTFAVILVMAVLLWIDRSVLA